MALDFHNSAGATCDAGMRLSHSICIVGLFGAVLAPAQARPVPHPEPISLPGNNTALKAINGGISLRATRLGFTTPGDGGYAEYNWSAVDCTAADDGVQVQPTSGSGCWLADFSGGKTSPQVWGAKCDDSTDDTAAITKALAFAAIQKRTLTFPATRCYSATGITVPAGAALAMESFLPANPPVGAGLRCANGVAVCLKFSSGAALDTTQATNITVVGTEFPTNGSTGIEFFQGYNIAAVNVNVYGFDTCIRWKAEGAGGLGFTGININSGACKTHYWVFDGWAEAKFTGGRVGLNGAGDYASQDMVYFTNTDCLSRGCGPNTVVFTGTQFNPGSLEPACWVRFGGIAPGGNQPEFIKFIGTHLETAGAAPGAKGVFCSDSTVSKVTGLYIAQSSFNVKDGLTPLFALNAATQVNLWAISDNYFGGCRDITLAPAPVTGPAFNASSFSNNVGCGYFSATSNGDGSKYNFLSTNGNFWNQLKIAGYWDGGLYMNDMLNLVTTDTASGRVGVTMPPIPFTPLLAFGGATTGWTQTGVGAYARTLDGGFFARMTINITGVGSAAGDAVISGLPLHCRSAGTDVSTPISVGNPVGIVANEIFPGYWNSAAGAYSRLNDTHLAAVGKQISGSVRCNETQ